MVGRQPFSFLLDGRCAGCGAGQGGVVERGGTGGRSASSEAPSPHPCPRGAVQSLRSLLRLRGTGPSIPRSPAPVSLKIVRCDGARTACGQHQW